jgi:hypothetical protein
MRLMDNLRGLAKQPQERLQPRRAEEVESPPTVEAAQPNVATIAERPQVKAQGE